MELIDKLDNTWCVYMIEAENGYFYTGITTSIQKRFQAHLLRKQGAKFFHTSAPKKVVYLEEGLTRQEASKKEYALKQLTRAQKRALINR